MRYQYFFFVFVMIKRVICVIQFESPQISQIRFRLLLRGGSDMIPPSTPLSGLVNGPLPDSYSRCFGADRKTMQPGLVTTEEAQKMRDLGILKGKWYIESEEEPSSDIQVSFILIESDVLVLK